MKKILGLLLNSQVADKQRDVVPLEAPSAVLARQPRKMMLAAAVATGADLLDDPPVMMVTAMEMMLVMQEVLEVKVVMAPKVVGGLGARAAAA